MSQKNSIAVLFAPTATYTTLQVHPVCQLFTIKLTLSPTSPGFYVPAVQVF